MTLEEKIAKIDKTYVDLQKFVHESEYEYGAMLIRIIVEMIVNSYTDYYVPEIKNKGQIPAIMEQITALEKCSNFPKSHIYNLHEMRKIGNMGSHQGEGKEVKGIYIQAIMPNVLDEINVWKSFEKEGEQKLIQMNTERQNILLNGKVEKDPTKIKVALVLSVIAFVVILCCTMNKTIQFFTMGLYYDESGLLLYWGCVIAYFILSAYCRPYGKIHKSLFNILTIYFILPRIYQVILCIMGEGLLMLAIVYTLIIFFFVG
ncbi:MAG: DUF4145 domain-containing protein, partial [Lachnospiraceae bacterium]|nr:DUF4145 domain-containing protein [Lachnospiraceae bacterium]